MGVLVLRVHEKKDVERLGYPFRGNPWGTREGEPL